MINERAKKLELIKPSVNLEEILLTKQEESVVSSLY
jgi:hypothetical protein